MAQETRGARQSAGATETASPSEQLQDALQELTDTMVQRAVISASKRLSGASGRLTDYAQSGGGGGLLAAVTGIDKLASGKSPIKAALSAGLAGAKGTVKEAVKNVTGSLLGRKGGGGKKPKITNITEQIDVGVPVDLAYRQWTRFGEFPKFMKKLEQVEQLSDEKVRWKAKIFLSRRSWESTIADQVPNERIVWRSEGDKGYIDGAVTFHDLAPNLTRIIVVLEYYPRGLFERTGNLWRAQGRRVRLELKHFQRYVMTQAALHPDDVEGWQGQIRESRVVENEPSERRRRTASEEPSDRRGSADRQSSRTAATKQRSR